MSEKVDRKVSFGRRAARASRYFIPGYPVIKALASAKETIGVGAHVIAEQNRELANRRRDPRSRTWNEAVAARPVDALPIETIERLCLRHKQVALACGFLASCFLIGSAVGGHFAGTFLGMLFVLLCLMFAVKYEHRLWQMETGRASPDEPLGGFRVFFAARDALTRILNPHLF